MASPALDLFNLDIFVNTTNCIAEDIETIMQRLKVEKSGMKNGLLKQPIPLSKKL